MSFLGSGPSHADEDAMHLLSEFFEFETRGMVDVKGKGPMLDFLAARKTDADPTHRRPT